MGTKLENNLSIQCKLNKIDQKVKFTQWKKKTYEEPTTHQPCFWTHWIVSPWTRRVKPANCEIVYIQGKKGKTKINKIKIIKGNKDAYVVRAFDHVNAGYAWCLPVIPASACSTMQDS